MVERLTRSEAAMSDADTGPRAMRWTAMSRELILLGRAIVALLCRKKGSKAIGVKGLF
jgi:hypothetical protein